MTARIAIAALGSFALACATAAPQKITAAEAFGPAPASTPRHAATPKPKLEVIPAGGAEVSPELLAALTRFGTVARQERGKVAAGAAMPSVEVANWQSVIAALDTFLARSPGRSSSYDIVRARITAEAELEMDARQYGDIPPELADAVLDRVNRLAYRMAEVRRLGVATAKRKTIFAWPVDPVVVTSLFGRRFHPILKTWKVHAGLDLAAEEGQLVSSAAAGVVIRAGPNGAHGIQVELQHPGGFVTRYSHLSQLLVEPGTMLQKGDPVGLAGSTGLATGAHLHFEVWRDGRPCDPLEELGRPEPDAANLAAL